MRLSPSPPKTLRIDSLGMISLSADRAISEYNDLHNQLLHDWKPRLVEGITHTKTQIQARIQQLQQLYKQHPHDERAPYIEIIILKLKKAVSTQAQLNIIITPKDSLEHSLLYTPKEQLKIQTPEYKNRAIKIVEEGDSKMMLKNKQPPKFSPLKDIKREQQQGTGSKGKVLVNKLGKQEKEKPKLPLNKSRTPTKMASGKYNKKPDNFLQTSKLSNTQKLQNLMLTIKMTKEEYLEYMKDD